MPTSPMFSYLWKPFLDGHEPSSAEIKGYLYCVACVQYCLLVLMALLAGAISLPELAIQDQPGHNARMRVGA